jgi:hypothetical protein
MYHHVQLVNLSFNADFHLMAHARPAASSLLVQCSFHQAFPLIRTTVCGLVRLASSSLEMYALHAILQYALLGSIALPVNPTLMVSVYHVQISHHRHHLCQQAFLSTKIIADGTAMLAILRQAYYVSNAIPPFVMQASSEGNAHSTMTVCALSAARSQLQHHTVQLAYLLMLTIVAGTAILVTFEKMACVQCATRPFVLQVSIGDLAQSLQMEIVYHAVASP